MADSFSGNGPGSHNPLDDRMRATFAAERADIERRHLAHDAASSARSRSRRWIPFAAAAAFIALAGVLIIGNRTGEVAVDLDVAQQGQTDWEVPQPDVPGDGPREATPVGIPLEAFPGNLETFPYITGFSFCSPPPDTDLVVVWNPQGEPVPVQLEPEVTGEWQMTRRLPVGTVVEQVGGCTSGGTSRGAITWYEIAGPAGQQPEWINANQLITAAAYQKILDGGPTPVPTPPGPPIGTPVQVVPAPVAPPTLNGCGEPTAVFPLRFVWGIQPDDPDGGLVAHSTPGVEAPVTRILQLDEVVALTGECALSTTNSKWYELRDPNGARDWVSGNFLADAAPACLVDESASGSLEEEPFFHTVRTGDRLSTIAERYNITVDALIRANPAMDPNLIINGQLLRVPGSVNSGAGLAIAQGDRVAFAAIDATRWQWYAAGEVVIGAPCVDPPTPDQFVTGPASDSFADFSCSALDSEVVVGTTERGSIASDATHIHNLRHEQGSSSVGPCTRIVIEFGTGLDGTRPHSVANALPLMTVEKESGSTRIVLPTLGFSAPDEPHRLDFETGLALVAVAQDRRPAVEVMYQQPGPVNVSFLENPARVIIDYINPPPLLDRQPGPFGDNIVLKQPIQSEITSAGVPVLEPIIVEGFGRPFEARGEYRVYSVPPDTNPITYFDTKRQPLVREFFSTTGWVDGWGEFSVQLQDFRPGTYIAVFGEVPPNDENVFVGAGQMFRIRGDEPQAGTYPIATILPAIHIAD